MYVQSLDFEDAVSCDRKMIAPFELDIFVPSRNVAIEYHGLYWHSNDLSVQDDAKLHRKKYEMCRKQDIKLLQFFSDEWANNRALCQSMISNALGVTSEKLNARDCNVMKIDKLTGQAFLQENHIAGATKRHRYTIGLQHKSKGLVGVMTLRVPVQQKWESCWRLVEWHFCKMCQFAVAHRNFLLRHYDLQRMMGSMVYCHMQTCVSGQAMSI